MKKYGQIQIYSPNTKAKKHLFSSHFFAAYGTNPAVHSASLLSVHFVAKQYFCELCWQQGVFLLQRNIS